MKNPEGLTLRQAALLTGFGYVLTIPVAVVEFRINPKLIIGGQIEQTVANISSHHGLFLTTMFGYLINFIGDIIAALGLYVLLAPVNRAVSLLAAWFRLIYTAAGVVAMFNLVTVYRVLTTPQYLALFGRDQLNAQVDLLLHSFRYGWTFSLVIFCLHLFLVGALVFRSGYIPRIFGPVLVADGLCLMNYEMQPYFWPNVNLGWLFILTFAELVFGLWLLVMGWTIREPVTISQR